MVDWAPFSFIVFLSNCAHTCLYKAHARLVLQRIWHFHAITWHLKQRPEKVWVFLTVITDLQARKTSLHILKLSRCSIWCMTVKAKTLLDDSQALHSIVGKYQRQDFPKVSNTTVCHNNKDNLSCLYVPRWPSQCCWIFSLILKDRCLLSYASKTRMSPNKNPTVVLGAEVKTHFTTFANTICSTRSCYFYK